MLRLVSPTELKIVIAGPYRVRGYPFHQDLKIDEESLRQNAAHLAKYCDVVVTLGNKDESFSLSINEQFLARRNRVFACTKGRRRRKYLAHRK
jgi:hypothetical protein